jgi:hypothetical protein
MIHLVKLMRSVPSGAPSKTSRLSKCKKVRQSVPDKQTYCERLDTVCCSQLKNIEIKWGKLHMSRLGTLTLNKWTEHTRSIQFSFYRWPNMLVHIFTDHADVQFRRACIKKNESSNSELLHAKEKSLNAQPLSHVEP